LGVAVLAEHITVAATVTEALVVVVVAQYIMQVHILIDPALDT
jgi:hypothetical protein